MKDFVVHLQVQLQTVAVEIFTVGRRSGSSLDHCAKPPARPVLSEEDRSEEDLVMSLQSLSSSLSSSLPSLPSLPSDAAVLESSSQESGQGRNTFSNGSGRNADLMKNLQDLKVLLENDDASSTATRSSTRSDATSAESILNLQPEKETKEKKKSGCILADFASKARRERDALRRAAVHRRHLAPSISSASTSATSASAGDGGQHGEEREERLQQEEKEEAVDCGVGQEESWKCTHCESWCIRCANLFEEL
jgi:hypothetical protein